MTPAPKLISQLNETERKEYRVRLTKEMANAPRLCAITYIALLEKYEGLKQQLKEYNNGKREDTSSEHTDI